MDKLRSGTLCVLVGGRGTGKTQCAVDVAITHEAYLDAMRGPGPESRNRYALAVEVFMTIKETYGDDAKRSEKEAVLAFIRPELLIVDEVQEKAGTDWEQRLLTTIVDRRYAAMKDTILIGNMRQTDVQEVLGTSITSRAQETGGIFLADWASFRGRQ